MQRCGRAQLCEGLSISLLSLNQAGMCARLISVHAWPDISDVMRTLSIKRIPLLWRYGNVVCSLCNLVGYSQC